MTVAPMIGEHDHQSFITCIICSENVSLSEVTAGSLYANGVQAFACSVHLEERAQWITAWALFDAGQLVVHPAMEFTI
jgi:hypothetical protein